MMRGRRTIGALVCAALVSGCIPDGRPETVIMDVLMLIVGAGRKSVVAAIEPQAAGQKLTSQLNVESTVTIGGLSGTYDVVLGSYGRFTGTAQIVGQKGAKLRDENSPALLAAVQGILFDALAADVTVIEAKAKINGKQTTGGVRKRYKGKIKFTGTLASGPNAGASVKGKISTKGDLTD